MTLNISNSNVSADEFIWIDRAIKLNREMLKA